MYELKWYSYLHWHVQYSSEILFAKKSLAQKLLTQWILFSKLDIWADLIGQSIFFRRHISKMVKCWSHLCSSSYIAFIEGYLAIIVSPEPNEQPKNLRLNEFLHCNCEANDNCNGNFPAKMQVSNIDTFITGEGLNHMTQPLNITFATISYIQLASVHVDPPWTTLPTTLFISQYRRALFKVADLCKRLC